MLINARVAGAVAIGGLLLALAAPVHAVDPASCRDTLLGRTCDVVSESPGSDRQAVHVVNPSQEKVTCAFNGEAIDCTSNWGTWSNAQQCWVKAVDPQPSTDEPIWEGRIEGAIYWCQPPAMPGSIGGGHLFWSPTAPPLVNPAQLARQAVDSMDLHAPRVGATPLPSSEAVSVIGLPTWLWIDDADSHSWGPITRTASTGGVTVTATARVAEVVWDMGDGHTVTCTGRGTEWTPAKGSEDSPTCGYRYARPGKRTITATAFWEVDWSGGGQTGTITFDLSGTRTVNVVELRAVNT